MNKLEIAFMSQLRAGLFDEAGATLDRWVENRDMLPAEQSFWRAHLAWRRGDRAGALATLTQAVDGGLDHNCLCLGSRAQYLFDSGSYRRALADFNALLADASPTVAEVLTLTANYHAAYWLAYLGDADFETAISRCDPSYAEWKAGRERTLDDIRSVYAKVRGARRPPLG